MIMFNRPQSNDPDSKWRRQLDQFVKEYQKELAALVWGISLQQGESDETLGIDIKPTPHFVSCPRKALEDLNHNVKGHIQEILGILDNFNPEKEVVMIAIGDGQIKLIQFESTPSPAECFQQLNEDIYDLLDKLEKIMLEKINC